MNYQKDNTMNPMIKGAITRQELACIYGICVKTLNKWFAEKGISIPKGIISPKDQEIIFSKLGIPKSSNLF